MKVIVNEETTALLNALKKIVKAESGSAKKGEDLEKNIIKIAVKAFLLIENKQLTADEFLVADKPLRESFELMVKVYNGRGRVKEEKIREALAKVEELLKKSRRDYYESISAAFDIEKYVKNIFCVWLYCECGFFVSSV